MTTHCPLEGREKGALLEMMIMADLMTKDPDQPIIAQAFVYSDASPILVIVEVESIPINPMVKALGFWEKF